MKVTHEKPDFLNLDLTSDIKEYEFSKETFRKIARFVTASDFREKDSTEILRYLIQELRLISFGMYLRRYLYLELKPEESFEKLDDDFYVEALVSCFRENHVPFHTDSCSTSPGRTARRWLSQNSVNRSVIFQLGFGLRMTTDGVSMFLQKVLLEEDFNFEDPKEVIYWFCYENRRPYAFAHQLLEEYEQEDVSAVDRSKPVKDWKKLTKRLEYRRHPENCLRNYLRRLKAGGQGRLTQIGYEVFSGLYADVCRQIAVNKPYLSDGTTRLTPDMIMPAKVEKELYAGIPRSTGGNLKKSSLSLLSEYMRGHLLSRQRIEKLISGKYAVRRFDIINLCFYLYGSESIEEELINERFLRFVEKTNRQLQKCHMFALHPNNPMEAFMMICMFTEMPIVTYSDVLELSFGGEAAERSTDADQGE